MKYYDGSKWSKINEEEQKQPLTDPTHTIRATFRISEDEVGKELLLISSQLGGDSTAITKLYINGKESKNSKYGKFVFDAAGDYLFEIEFRDGITLSSSFNSVKELIALDCSNIFADISNCSVMCMNCTNLESINFDNFAVSNTTHFTSICSGCSNLSKVSFKNLKTNTNQETCYFNAAFKDCTKLSSFDFNEVFKNVQFRCKVEFTGFLEGSGITSFYMNNIKINASSFKNMFLNCTNLKHLIITNCIICGLGEKSAAWTFGSLNIETINFDNTEFVTCDLSSFLKRGNDESIPCNLSLTGTKFINCDLTNAFSDINTKTVNLTTTIFQNCFGSQIFTSNPYI